VAPLNPAGRVRALCGRPRGQGAGPPVHRVRGRDRGTRYVRGSRPPEARPGRPVAGELPAPSRGPRVPPPCTRRGPPDGAAAGARVRPPHPVGSGGSDERAAPPAPARAGAPGGGGHSGELFASTADVLERTLEVERRIERESEERLLAELFELAGGGGRAVCGVAPTLEALWRGAVQVLVAADDVHGGGSDCPTCGRLEPGSVATCPSCGSTTRAVHDLVHRAMGRTMQQAGRVEVVHADAARRLREADSAPCCATGGDPRARPKIAGHVAVTNGLFHGS
jgi:hypothetical protein